MSVFRFCALVAAGLLLGCVNYGCSSTGSKRPTKSDAVESDSARRPAPDFALKDINGRTVHLSDYRGKVIVLDFWATWCGPCKIEIPWFMEFERKLKDKGFAVIGVAMDDEGWEAVKPFISQMGINYRVVLGNDKTAAAFGGVDALPTTFLIDRKGNIAAVHVGLVSKSDFQNGIEKLLQAPRTDSRVAGWNSLSAQLIRSK